MADRLHDLDDEKLKKMEKKISAIYSPKKKQIFKALNGFLKQYDKKANEILKEIKKVDNDEDRATLKAKYDKLYRDIRKSKRFKELTDKITNELYLTNVQANDYINGKMINIYKDNYNGFNSSLNRHLKGFTPLEVNDKDVKEYANLDLNIVNKSKDQKWNEKNINKALLVGAGLLLGTKQIAKRVSAIAIKRNAEGMKRQANDMTTYSSNRGRMDAMYRASDFGYEIWKQWIATLDNVTRPTHRMLDKVKIPLDEKFDNGLMYPRDPNGDAKEIYHCRCAIQYVDKTDELQGTRSARQGTVTGGFWDDSSFADTKSIEVANMTYKEWQKKYGRYYN